VTDFSKHPVRFADAIASGCFRAWGIRAVDGDTVLALVDLGFAVRIEASIRVAGVNSPEVVGAERAQGLAAAAYTDARVRDRPLLYQPDMLPVAGDIATSFRRYVGAVLLLDGHDWLSLGELLVQAGLAAEVKA
jgi:endonuclease YncB( thermonuclease family)